jgi:lambda repressor-like predicted transcriptional regulator
MIKNNLKSLNIYRVKEACKIRGISFTKLASDIGCTPASLYNWFNDGFEKENADLVAGVLDFSVDVLSRRLKG